MKNKLSLLLSTVILLSSNTFAEKVPNIFTPNTPAKAAEVNENFDFLVHKSMGANLVDGEVELAIDCTTNSAALNEAYAEHVNYRNLNFSIKGNCYGDITVKRTFDGDSNWEGNSYQVAGQTISIYPQDGQVAGLIPNDLSDKVAIWGGFGGGLYLNDLTITLSANNWDYGAAFSRNGQGAVNNVTIIGPDTPNGAGIWLQEGAQAYILGVDISKVTWGVFAHNNSAVRFLGNTSTISSQSEGVKVLGSSVRQQAAINVTSAAGAAIDIDGGTNWMGWDHNITAIGDNIVIQGGSTLVVGSLAMAGVVNIDNSVVRTTTFSSKNLQVTNSELSLGTATTTTGNTTLNMSTLNAQSLSTVGFDLWNSSVNIAAGTISAQTNLTQQSFMHAENATFSAIKIERTSTFSGQDLTILDVTVQDNSLLDLSTATITRNFSLDSNSTGVLEDVTFNGSTFNVNQANARIMGTTKMPTSKLACYGFSQIEYEGVSDVLTTVPNSNCLDQSSITTLMNLIKSNHILPE